MNPEFALLSDSAIRFMINSTLDTLEFDPQASEEDRDIQRQAAVEALIALDPRDANQANLAAHAVVAHHSAMACFRRAAQPGLPDNVAMRILGRALAFSRLAERMQTALHRAKGGGRMRARSIPTDEAPAATVATPAPVPVPAAEAPARPATPPTRAAAPNPAVTQPGPVLPAGQTARMPTPQATPAAPPVPPAPQRKTA
jgi:hypothetical protein